jgi:hypothetical protein
MYYMPIMKMMILTNVTWFFICYSPRLFIPSPRSTARSALLTPWQSWTVQCVRAPPWSTSRTAEAACSGRHGVCSLQLFSRDYCNYSNLSFTTNIYSHTSLVHNLKIIHVKAIGNFANKSIEIVFLTAVTF